MTLSINSLFKISLHDCLNLSGRLLFLNTTALQFRSCNFGVHLSQINRFSTLLVGKIKIQQYDNKSISRFKKT